MLSDLRRRARGYAFDKLIAPRADAPPEYAYQVLDVSADEAELSWATTAAKTTELPLVFVAGQPVGGWDALLAADSAGELKRLVGG